MFSVPVALLRAGDNVVSAETHLNYRSSRTLTFELSMDASPREGELLAPPERPLVQGEPIGSDGARVTWTQPGGTPVDVYRLLRDGAVVAIVPAAHLSYEDAGLGPSSSYRYQVVAVDQFGQTSVPGEVMVTTAGSSTLVAGGASWLWRYSSSEVSSQWREVGFDDSGWSGGVAPLGFGSSLVGTDISVGVPPPRPLSAHFRHSFSVSDPAQLQSAEVSVIADDGVVVYVNGTEVGRANMPSGSISQGSYAMAAPNAAVASADPQAVLRAGGTAASG